MPVSGVETDPVDREFDRLLAETGRAASCGATAAPISDGAFESLLTTFRSLDDPGTASDVRGDIARPTTPAAMHAAADDVTRAWQSLVPHLSGTADPSMLRAARRVQRALVALQLARHAGSCHAVLAVNIASQPFALALDQVADVLDASRVRLERDGAQAWAIVGTERVPLRFARHWLARNADMTIAEDAWIVMAAPGPQRAGFVVDGIEEVVPASRQPPGALWRGMHGVAAVAAVGARLLPLLDLATLPNESARGG